jgi:hypothetical protein
MRKSLTVFLLLLSALFFSVVAYPNDDINTTQNGSESSDKSSSKGPTTSGELLAELKKAAVISDDVVRLAKYDSIMKEYKIAPITRAIKTLSKWRVTEKTNPIDDSKTTVLSLTANEKVGSYGGSKPMLIIRRMGNNLTAYIATNEFLGSDSMEVTTRVDKKQAVVSTWGISTDHKAAFSPNAKLLLADLERANKLLVSLAPYSESPMLFSFDLSGLDVLANKVK